MPRDCLVRVPTSVGELIDKITILEIKTEQIKDAAKLSNVRVELDLLVKTLHELRLSEPRLASLTQQLKTINQALWVVEDDLRELEAKKDFGADFVQKARLVYITNDQRAAVKKEINLMTGSTLVEEKSYKGA